MGALGMEIARIHDIEFQKRGLPNAHLLMILAEEGWCMHEGLTDNGYPQYRRRDDGRTVTVQGIELDNRYVVPYNPWFTHKYNCHINVEVCTSISSVKFLYKYVYKGHDRLSVSLAPGNDEIQQHIDARYLSPTDSCWRIMRFELQAKTHIVVTMPIHLENQQNVLKCT
uniref:Uncharacterized protein n=1 Tax=Anopheles minimus TaxID=112268 RepID=A0A182W8J2_9DIPT